MEHTKGEWIVDWHTTMNLPYKYTVSEEQETDEEAEANAKLIAAAPDLLEALLYYQEGIDHFYDRVDFNHSFLDAKAITFMNESGIKIKQAVNKAKGK